MGFISCFEFKLYLKPRVLTLVLLKELVRLPSYWKGYKLYIIQISILKISIFQDIGKSADLSMKSMTIDIEDPEMKLIEKQFCKYNNKLKSDLI